MIVTGILLGLLGIVSFIAGYMLAMHKDREASLLYTLAGILIIIIGVIS